MFGQSNFILTQKKKGKGFFNKDSINIADVLFVYFPAYFAKSNQIFVYFNFPVHS